MVDCKVIYVDMSGCLLKQNIPGTCEMIDQSIFHIVSANLPQYLVITGTVPSIFPDWAEAVGMRGWMPDRWFSKYLR